MKKAITIFIILISVPLAADELYFMDGTITSGKIILIDVKQMEYVPQGQKRSVIVDNDLVRKAVFVDGDEIVLHNRKNRMQSDGSIQFIRPEKEKSAWYIGFGLGWGQGSFSFTDGQSAYAQVPQGTYKSECIFLDFGTGLILNKYLHIGADLSMTSGQNNNSNIKSIYGLDISTAAIVATYFPFGKGLCFRAGAGLCRVSIMTGYESNTYNGTSVTGGVGYMFWVGRSFNLGLNCDYSYQKYFQNDSGISKSHYLCVYASFYWF